MKWGRFGAFLVIALCILGLTAGTSVNLWKNVKLGLDLKGGYDLVYRIVLPKGQQITTQDQQAMLQAVNLRVNGAGIGSPSIQLEDKNLIDVSLAGAYNASQANAIIGKTAQLAIYGNVQLKVKGKVVNWTTNTFDQLAAQPGAVVTPAPGAEPLATGADMKNDAHYAQDPTSGQNTVVVSFKSANLWTNVTQKYNGKLIFTFLGDRLINDAVVQGVNPSGTTQITMPGYSVQQCTQLANELNAGALPYPLHLVSETSVGPQLGAASLKATMVAGLIALILIFIFMLLIYRMAGLIADIALVAYGYVVLALFSGFGIVLTLPGLAALILGIGMAVDANVIAYERIKDEVRNGRSLQSAVIAGNKRSLRTILDSHATTFIAGAVMYWFGEGDIKGFGIALMLSIIVSLVTAVVLSRIMLVQYTRSNIVRNPFWYGSRKGALHK